MIQLEKFSNQEPGVSFGVAVYRKELIVCVWKHELVVRW